MVQQSGNLPFPLGLSVEGSLRSGEGNDMIAAGGELLLCTVPRLVSNFARPINYPEAWENPGVDNATLTKPTP